MKRLVVLVMALGLVACDGDNDNPAGPTTTGPIIFAAQLSAANEVPPVMGVEGNGRGSVTITIAIPRDSAGNPTDQGTVTFAMQAQGFNPGSAIIAAHIHPGRGRRQRRGAGPHDAVGDRPDGARRRDRQPDRRERDHLSRPNRGDHGEPGGLLLQHAHAAESDRRDPRTAHPRAVTA